MKTISISMRGVQNLNNFPDSNDDFTFFFSDLNSFQMKINFAEFISPKVSKLRKNDPTLHSLRLDYISSNLQEYFTEDIIQKILFFSSGNPIYIDGLEGFKLLIVSILLENIELFREIEKTFDMQINENNLDQYLHNLTIIYQFSQKTEYFSYSNIIGYISSHFHSLDKSKLHLPRPIIYSIISDPHLKLENEDTLFNFIQNVFSTDKTEPEDESSISINSFLAKVNFLRLSETKLKEALNLIEFNEVGKELWMKVINCTQYFKDSIIDADSTRYVFKKLIFKPKSDPRLLNGIIRYLTNVAGGNVHLKNVVIVSKSSECFSHNPHEVENVVDLDSDKYFHSDDHPNSWIKYDFGNRRIHPTHYTIKNRNNACMKSDKSEGNSGTNPRNWIIEGSNNDIDWKKLDERKNDPSFLIKDMCQVFEIRENLDPNEYFKYIKITQNGLSSDGRNYFVISAIEYFGDLYEP